MKIVTPDGHYLVVKGKLWRCSDPSLDEELRQSLVSELMAARREIKEAQASHDTLRMRRARERVQKAKVALGERGPVWWEDGSPDLNRHSVSKSPYVEWFSSLPENAGKG